MDLPSRLENSASDLPQTEDTGGVHPHLDSPVNDIVNVSMKDEVQVLCSESASNHREGVSAVNLSLSTREVSSVHGDEDNQIDLESSAQNNSSGSSDGKGSPGISS